MEYTMKTRENK